MFMAFMNRRPEHAYTGCEDSFWYSCSPTILPSSTAVQIHGVSAESQAATGSTLHKGAVTAVSYFAPSQQLLTAGEDGALTVHRIDSSFQGTDPQRCTTVTQPDPLRSFIDACWLGPDQLLTVATGGTVQIWDARAGSGAVRGSQQDWVDTALRQDHRAGLRTHATSSGALRASLASISSVAALASAPHACAVGHRVRGSSAAALMTTWDLRSMHDPQVVVLADHVSDAAGSVLLRPDPLRAGATSVPLIAATTAGQLLEVDLGRGAGVEMEAVCSVEGAWVDVQADVSTGRLLVGCTDQQSVGVVERGGVPATEHSGLGLLPSPLPQIRAW